VFSPASFPDLNAVLHELVSGVQSLLTDNFLAAYLQGSFGVGDWDEHSDVDFSIVIERDLTEAEVAALQALHARLFNWPSPWARHLEGSYFPQAIIRRADPAQTPLWYLDNTHSQLIRSTHDNTLVVRWVTREYGMALAGPAPRELIDPISAADLQHEVRATMQTWGAEIFSNHYSIYNRWAQPFAVLSYCRMMHALHTGRIHSKLAGARWAQAHLDARWHGLIQRAWAERPHPSLKITQPADPTDLALTLDFIRHTLEVSK
jgi:hypothetical protein